MSKSTQRKHFATRVSYYPGRQQTISCWSSQFKGHPLALGSEIYYSGIQLNISQCEQRPPPPRSTQPRRPVGLRLRNPNSTQKGIQRDFRALLCGGHILGTGFSLFPPASPEHPVLSWWLLPRPSGPATDVTAHCFFFFLNVFHYGKIYTTYS